MAVTISGTTGVGVSTTPLYPSDILIGSVGTTAGAQVIGARLTGYSNNADILDISNVRGTAGADWQTAGWRIQQKIDATWKAYIQFNGTASGINNSGISFGTGDSTVSANSVTERMRIDGSGNVGIGMSPSKRLDVVGQFRVRNSAASGYSLIEYGDSATATNNWHVGSEGNGTFRFYNGNFGAGVERMRIDSSGRVTMPAQPAFFAQHALSTTTTPSEIIWGTTQFNIGSNYSTTTGRFTAPVAGTYFFKAHTLTANANAGETRIVFYKNGVSISGLGFISAKTATTWKTIMAHGHIYLAAGDYVSVFLTAVAGSLYNDAVWNSFSGHLVG